MCMFQPRPPCTIPVFHQRGGRCQVGQSVVIAASEVELFRSRSHLLRQLEVLVEHIVTLLEIARKHILRLAFRLWANRQHQTIRSLSKREYPCVSLLQVEVLTIRRSRQILVVLRNDNQF